MTLWEWGALVLFAGAAPCLMVAARGGFLDRLIALNLATSLIAQGLLVLTVAFGHDYLIDVALALVILAYPGSLLFAHFREHWL